MPSDNASEQTVIEQIKSWKQSMSEIKSMQIVFLWE